MLSRHRVSRAAIELIKRFEGYRRHAAQLPDGRWTIGYGHTLTAREGAEVSEPDAEALLVYDLISVQHAVNENVYAPLSQNQFDALSSFAFNIGLDNFRRSQVLKRLNAGSAVQAACAMELWRKADFEGERIVVDTLVRRRATEKALFLTPPGDDFAPAPSPIIRPLIDLDALDLVPLRRPVELETSFEDDRITVRREPPPEEIGAEPPPEPTPEPVPAVTAAAEAVSARLETIFPDPGEEPEPEAEPAIDVEVEGIFAADDAEAATDVRPQADFARPITTHAEPESESEPEPVLDLEDPAVGERTMFEPEPASILDAELDIPRAPNGFDAPEPTAPPEAEPRAFIPARQRPAPQPKEISVVWDLLLALFGLAFFGFGIFWGLNARVAPTGGVITPLMVAWPAGLAGIGFVVVSVFRLLQRLGREAEQD
ncbi:MAG: lysozyme [Alphaproteobacteria bacterium]|nr:lysozyme [Alphaproteobacteria bacterium]MBU1512664.1 lysozyme [Alphaproteobacteria bacterium]MBU2095058.1 lysozyme [Alphaproteobacteria bacterium]MBU2151823.1 lysozyme [Alphaproteobacteria bacterium]MBU2306222.1 lysozyme [Alphaproteobacteria bacterium]